ncbi:Crp/Fnr family transcriptional regulator [Parasphingopyxis sp. CP4]|uniref:Crp/Fnr family transcriptional regulator n=1 Tax=Parasphingopyxis sp. CP4 TaxID=2724527 RepID=UPI00159FCDE3|nr:Crp/Fnr family transcriptional regulator [Parasphingopyxis sp. CP4]QLC22046.1 Crp/Fnr family transcriptional regulator [Parasphingopyxis sp. CP4]
MDAPFSPFFGEFLGRMPEEMQAALASAGTLMRYRDGATIQQRGDRKPGISVIAEGAVRMSATDAEGERSTYLVHGPGDAFGEMTLFLDIPRTLDAVAVGDTAIHEVSRAGFTQLLDTQPAIRDHLLVSLARQLSLALERLDDQRRLPANARLAKALVDLAEPDGDHHIVRASQSALAEAIATSRVTTGKVLTELAEAGLVETAYRAVRIADLSALQDWVAARSLLTPLNPRD